ncbi:hypothetical protein Bpfe_027467 [Biomphalaria pfeifferi]|uniref:Uncharacterized protein n=1 Tax=Biomphalaria pfeifferi TaxID=112525 RepID=A0AAD8AVB6_BIOPF|nr:hypothetical protein Bpfe_027467 [Biomphalaria pfeifferi]
MLTEGGHAKYRCFACGKEKINSSTTRGLILSTLSFRKIEKIMPPGPEIRRADVIAAARTNESWIVLLTLPHKRVGQSEHTG